MVLGKNSPYVPPLLSLMVPILGPAVVTVLIYNAPFDIYLIYNNLNLLFTQRNTQKIDSCQYRILTSLNYILLYSIKKII